MIVCDDCKEAKAEYAYVWKVDRLEARHGNKLFGDERGPYEWTDGNTRTVAHEFVDLCDPCAGKRGWLGMKSVASDEPKETR